MTNQRPWVRGELPWITSGPLFRIHQMSVPAVDVFLDRHAYQRVDLDGTRMTSRLDAHLELRRAFGFPQWCGTTWDAFTDCFGDYVASHAGGLVAVLWTGIQTAARVAPATVAEVGWALLDAALTHQPTLPPSTRPVINLDVFTIGTGADFDQAPQISDSE